MSLIKCRHELQRICKERGLVLTPRERQMVVHSAARLCGTHARPYGGGGYLPTADEQINWKRSE